MLWSVLTTSPSSPTRTLTAYSSAPRRTSSASSWPSLMIRRLSASACWVSPRSSIRNAACSWARATIRSASSCAFSMIRSPSELIRFAARTSSGTATRSSSMRPSAAAWSMTTLLVRGRRRPFAMIDSRRSTRKMMSIGVPSGGGRPGRRVVGRDYRTAPRRLSAMFGERRGADRAAALWFAWRVKRRLETPEAPSWTVRRAKRRLMATDAADPGIEGDAWHVVWAIRRRTGCLRATSRPADRAIRTLGTWGEPTANPFSRGRSLIRNLERLAFELTEERALVGRLARPAFNRAEEQANVGAEGPLVRR